MRQGTGRNGVRGRVAAVALAAVLVGTGVGTPAYAASFGDVAPDAWYADSVSWCADRGLMTGYEDGGFGAESTLTCYELATILWRNAEPDAAASYVAADAANETGMADVLAGQWYTAAANWAVSNNIVNGYDLGGGARAFGGNDALTAERFVTILANYADAEGEAAADGSAVDALYTDGGSISAWARRAAVWARERGVLSGYPNGDGTYRLEPGEPILRGRAAAIIANAGRRGVITVADPTPEPDPTPQPTPSPEPDPAPDPTPAPTPVAQEYTVTFVSEGETISTARYRSGEAIARPADPTREGYTFEGWSPEVPATCTGDATYTAQWAEAAAPEPTEDVVPLSQTYVTLYADGELVFADDDTTDSSKTVVAEGRGNDIFYPSDGSASEDSLCKLMRGVSNSNSDGDGTGVATITSTCNILVDRTDLSRAFSGCIDLNDISGLAKWDVSGVTDFSSMFAWTSVSDISSLSKWDVSKATDMSYMFGAGNASYTPNKITSLTPLADWDVSNVKDMSYMFCSPVTTLAPLSKWNVSNVTNMAYMFGRCTQLTNLSGLEKWDTSSVTDMSGLFFDCEKLSNLAALSEWNVSKVTDMHNMFGSHWFYQYDGCVSLTSLSGLEKWDTSHVTNMASMFQDCTALSDASAIEDWNVSSVTNMGDGSDGSYGTSGYVFQGCTSLKSYPSWYTIQG